jgi:hypothetical protein
MASGPFALSVLLFVAVPAAPWHDVLIRSREFWCASF